MTKQEILSELNELIHDSPVRLPIEVMKGLKDSVEYIEKPVFCPYCGQALDWKDSEPE